MKMNHISRLLTKFTLLVTIILCASLQSCRVASQNGSFDAQWRLDEIVYPDGTSQKVGDIYYSFWRHTCTLSNAQGETTNGNIVYVEDQSVTMELPLIQSDELAYWHLPVDAEPVASGKSFTVKFEIEKLNSTKLVMRSTTPGKGAYYFTKF